ncbi:MAG: 1-(5-phosphoribosyl)-5-[(5-phosphoribosylamino)methylideneamino]imidazole-4-carboxamide isomerase [Promethearchaeota archaeon]
MIKKKSVPIVIPAIDIQNGKCVRLTNGLINRKTIYFKDPIEALNFWENEGAKRIHIVDLDGAFGIGTNYSLIEKMIKHKASLEIQIGGGIRSVKKARKLIDLGVDKIITGTEAVRNPDFIKELVQSIGKNTIIVALDLKNGKPAIKGWTETVNKDIYEFAKIMEEKGAGYILMTSTEGDGAFIGPDLINTKKMIEAVNIPVFAAGGVRDKRDIIKLKNLGVTGIIIGKALYENRIKYSEVKNI